MLGKEYIRNININIRNLIPLHSPDNKVMDFCGRNEKHNMLMIGSVYSAYFKRKRLKILIFIETLCREIITEIIFTPRSATLGDVG